MKNPLMAVVVSACTQTRVVLEHLHAMLTENRVNAIHVIRPHELSGYDLTPIKIVLVDRSGMSSDSRAKDIASWVEIRHRRAVEVWRHKGWDSTPLKRACDEIRLSIWGTDKASCSDPPPPVMPRIAPKVPSSAEIDLQRQLDDLRAENAELKRPKVNRLPDAVPKTESKPSLAVPPGVIMEKSIESAAAVVAEDEPTDAPGLARLTYSPGVTISFEPGKLVNLTDMWRASGGDDSKRPANWLQTERARIFVDFLAKSLNVAVGYLLDPRPGKGGGTRAHWQIAAAYAEYLSPAFHKWWNDCARSAIEGKALPAKEVRSAADVLRLTATALDEQKAEILAAQEARVAPVEAKVDHALEALKDTDARVRAYLSHAPRNHYKPPRGQMELPDKQALDERRGKCYQWAGRICTIAKVEPLAIVNDRTRAGEISGSIWTLARKLVGAAHGSMREMSRSELERITDDAIYSAAKEVAWKMFHINVGPLRVVDAHEGKVS